MLSDVLGVLWSTYTLWALVVLLLAGLVRNHFHHGLNKYPAPAFASLTDWWRFVVVARRKAQFTYLKLHQQLGDVVRLGPNALSFADPRAIKVIYGLNNKLPKVPIPSSNSTHYRPNNIPTPRATSTPSKCKSPKA